MKSIEEIKTTQNELVGNLVNTNDEKEMISFQAQIRTLSWVLDGDDIEKDRVKIPVVDSKDEGIGGD
jgi:hypothetical protein